VQGELKYDLYGVVEHSGLPNYGHYVCTISSSPSTLYLNDSLVDSITDTRALNQEAYILFYVRQGKFPWFLSLLDGKDTLHAEDTRGASPVSVLENIDANCSTSSRGGSSTSSGDKLGKNEANQLELEKDETSTNLHLFLRSHLREVHCVFPATTIQEMKSVHPDHISKMMLLTVHVV